MNQPNDQGPRRRRIGVQGTALVHGEVILAPRPLHRPGGTHCWHCQDDRHPPQSPSPMMDWNIQTRAHACQACGKPFADRQAYRTLLFEEPVGYLRQDVCSSCWDSQFSHGAVERKGFISQWQGLYEKPESKPEPMAKENAETLLRKLCALDDPRYHPACFILAVMLERKRFLKVKAQSYRGAQRVFVYEHPRSGDLFTILDPNLQLDQLEQVQRDVAHLMEHGLPGEPEASATTPPASVAPIEVDAEGETAAPADTAPTTPTPTPAPCV